MQTPGEVDQFQRLEEKVESFINFVNACKKEKDSLLEKIQIQEGRIADLTAEVDHLKVGRERAKQRILSLLEKLEKLEI